MFAFSGGDPDACYKAGPSLMFVTIPKVFDSAWASATAVGILFFLLVLFAAMTSSIALTESAVSTFQDELGWSRHKATADDGRGDASAGQPVFAQLRPAGGRARFWACSFWTSSIF